MRISGVSIAPIGIESNLNNSPGCGIDIVSIAPIGIESSFPLKRPPGFPLVSIAPIGIERFSINRDKMLADMSQSHLLVLKGFEGTAIAGDYGSLNRTYWY